MVDRPVNMFFFVALVLSLIDLLFRSGLGLGVYATPTTNVLLFTSYLLLSVYAAFGVFRTDDAMQNVRGFFTTHLWISVVVFGGPALVGYAFTKIPVLSTHITFTIVALILTQLWVFIIGFGFDQYLWKGFRILFWSYVIILMLSLVYQNAVFITQLGETPLGGQGVGLNAFLKETFTQGGKNFWSLVTTGKVLTQRGQQKFNETLALATGDYYTGRVDSKATVPNKVDIKDFKATQPEFRDIDPVTVFATLSAETLDTEILGEATIACSGSNDGSKGIKQNFEPASFTPDKIKLVPYNSWPLTCTFKEGTFKPGKNVEFGVSGAPNTCGQSI
ncbi:MAG: hypothetical protein AABY13_00680, partial [Nanoarchaeota archaeon]